MKGKVKRFAVVLLTAAMALNSAGMATFADTIRVSTPSAADKVVPGESTDDNKAQKEKLKTAYINKATSSDAAFTEDRMPSTDPDNPWGVIRIDEPTGNDGWYTDRGLTITIENSKDDESGRSIDTVYKLWNYTENQNGEGSAVATGTASDGTDGSSVTIELSEMFPDCTEGEWNLEVWNQLSSAPSKLATTTSSGGLLLPLQRGIITARPEGRYRKHCYWSAIKRYSLNLLSLIPLLAL